MNGRTQLLREVVSLLLEADDDGWGEDPESVAAPSGKPASVDDIPKGAVSVPAFVALYLLDVGAASLQEISDRVQAWRGKGITKQHLEQHTAGLAAAIDEQLAYFDRIGPRGKLMYKLTPTGVAFAQREHAKMLAKGKPTKPTLRTFNVGERVVLSKASDAFDVDGLDVEGMKRNFRDNISLCDDSYDRTFSYKGRIYNLFGRGELSKLVVPDVNDVPEELYDASTLRAHYDGSQVATATDLAEAQPCLIELTDDDYITVDEYYRRFVKLPRGVSGTISSSVTGDFAPYKHIAGALKHLKNCLLIDTDEGQRYVPISALKYA